MYKQFSDFLKNKQRICIIQAENPDGDSLGSALALEEAITTAETYLYCPVEIPKYMRYFEGWSRVEIDFDYRADAYIIVDTASSTLLSKLLDDPVIRNCLLSKPVFVIDHHVTEADLEFDFEQVIEPLSSCCALIYKILVDQNIAISPLCAENLLYGIMSDTLGLTSQSVMAEDYAIAAKLIESGAKIADMEERRRELSKKSARILDYKADLIKRVEYHLDGKLATILIPFEDIHEYSDEYNPSVLIIEELRMVQGVELAIAIKTYPDGKITGKIRASQPIADQIAGYFGGGGHPYAAGFRIYDEDYDELMRDLISVVDRLLGGQE